MEATKILQADVLDIIFENRNKDYGAYSLRRNYYKQISLALGITFCVAAAFSVYISVHSKNTGVVSEPPHVVVVDNIVPLKKPEKRKVEIPQPRKAAAPLKVNMTRLTKPVVSPDKDVTETPPKQDATLTIGPVTQKGRDMHGLLAAPPEVKGIGGNSLKLGSSIVNGSGDSFMTVQIEAKFPGGEEAWRKYLQANLRQNIPLDNGAPQGQYAVVVSFLVSVDGSISDVKAVNAQNPDYGTAAEAVRVIMRGPKWTPAIQNGKPVPYHQKQRIIFDVQQD